MIILPKYLYPLLPIISFLDMGHSKKVQIDATQMTDVQFIFPPRLLFKNYPYCYQHIPIESNWQVVGTRFTNTHQLFSVFPEMLSCSQHVVISKKQLPIPMKHTMFLWILPSLPVTRISPFIPTYPIYISSYGFPMGFLWVSYGFPMGFLWVSYCSKHFYHPMGAQLQSFDHHGTRRRPRSASGSATSARQARSFRRTSFVNMVQYHGKTMGKP